MPRIIGSQHSPFGGNNSYMYMDYSFIQDVNTNRSLVTWTIGVHNGAADIRWDNAQAAWSASVGTIGPGDANPGPVSTGWPTPQGQNSDIPLETGQFFITHNGSGNATISVSGSVHTDFFNGTLSSGSIALPQLAQTPAAPSACTATWVSDARIDVAWTNNSTGTAPYANIKVYRRVDGGSWTLRATLGVVTSYSDTSVSANHKYEYRVTAVGVKPVETSPATAASPVWTTPTAPTNCVATKLSNGDIRITWSETVPYSEHNFEIQESQNGGAFANLVTNVAANSTSFDHVAPSTGVTHKYRVRAKTTSGTLRTSAYSNESNTVTLLSTANAPTNLAPSGVSHDATEAIVFTWTHNPTDGTPQNRFRIQYEIDGGSTVTIGPTTTSTQSYTMPASTLPNGSTITWRVATAGQNTTLSANSSTASFTTRDRPTTTIDTPTGTYTESRATVNWAYFQAQGSAQATWKAFLYKENPGPTYELLETKAGSGTGEEVTFDTPLLDGGTYAVLVEATAANGLKSIASGMEFEIFDVSFLPPAAITLSTNYDPDTGWMHITVVGAAEESGVTEPIAMFDLQRKINDGEWITWVKDFAFPAGELEALIIDTAPTINGTNNYRAISYSDLPSSAISAEEANVTNEQRWGFLSTGSDFATQARMRAELDVRATIRRDKAQHYFAGRERPVELSGEHITNRLSITATLNKDGPNSTAAELEAIGITSTLVLWRDYTGRRIFASLFDLNIDYRTAERLIPVSFALQETDYQEHIS